MRTNYQEYYSLDVPCVEDQTYIMDKKRASQGEINHLMVSLIYCQGFNSQMPACRQLNAAPARVTSVPSAH
jgi:hypothetical protein